MKTKDQVACLSLRPFTNERTCHIQLWLLFDPSSWPARAGDCVQWRPTRRAPVGRRARRTWARCRACACASRWSSRCRPWSARRRWRSTTPSARFYCRRAAPCDLGSLLPSLGSLAPAGSVGHSVACDHRGACADDLCLHVSFFIGLHVKKNVNAGCGEHVCATFIGQNILAPGGCGVDTPTRAAGVRETCAAVNVEQTVQGRRTPCAARAQVAWARYALRRAMQGSASRDAGRARAPADALGAEMAAAVAAVHAHVAGRLAGSLAAELDQASAPPFASACAAAHGARSSVLLLQLRASAIACSLCARAGKMVDWLGESAKVPLRRTDAVEGPARCAKAVTEKRCASPHMKRLARAAAGGGRRALGGRRGGRARALPGGRGRRGARGRRAAGAARGRRGARAAGAGAALCGAAGRRGCGAPLPPTPLPAFEYGLQRRYKTA